MKNQAAAHEIFRPALTPVAVCVAIIGLSLVTVELLIEEGRAFNLWTYLVGVIAGLLFSWVWAWIMSLVFTAKLGPEGLYGHSVWGTRRFVE